MRRTPALVDGRDIGRDDQQVGAEVLGDQRAHGVLVDDRLDTLEAVLAHGDGHPAPATADDDVAEVEEHPDRLKGLHADRSG
jgi:hypothetical protein